MNVNNCNKTMPFSEKFKFYSKKSKKRQGQSNNSQMFALEDGTLIKRSEYLIFAL